MVLNAAGRRRGGAVARTGRREAKPEEVAKRRIAEPKVEDTSPRSRVP